jgi:hypothetical protein
MREFKALVLRAFLEYLRDTTALVLAEPVVAVADAGV